MKRIITILAISLNILIFSTLIKAADAPKVLLILPDALPQYLDNMLNKEVNVMKSMLEKANFNVVVATTNGLPIKGSTVTLTPDLKLSDVKGNDYVGIIIACMGSGEYTPVSPIAVLIVKQAITQGKPVAASHSSVNILAEAGVLAGKRYAFRTDPLGIGRRPDDRFTGAIYGGTGVVQDGKIITCGTCPETAATYSQPDGTAELTQAFITTLTTKK